MAKKRPPLARLTRAETSLLDDLTQQVADCLDGNYEIGFVSHCGYERCSGTPRAEWALWVEIAPRLGFLPGHEHLGPVCSDFCVDVSGIMHLLDDATCTCPWRNDELWFSGFRDGRAIAVRVKFNPFDDEDD